MAGQPTGLPRRSSRRISARCSLPVHAFLCGLHINLLAAIAPYVPAGDTSTCKSLSLRSRQSISDKSFEAETSFDSVRLARLLVTLAVSSGTNYSIILPDAQVIATAPQIPRRMPAFRANRVQATNFANAAKFMPVPVLQRRFLLGTIIKYLRFRLRRRATTAAITRRQFLQVFSLIPFLFARY